MVSTWFGEGHGEHKPDVLESHLNMVSIFESQSLERKGKWRSRRRKRRGAAGGAAAGARESPVHPSPEHRDPSIVIV